MVKKKIAIITGTRADYGLLRSLIYRLYECDKVDPILIVTGTHLSPEFGMTLREIEKDGFFISEKIEILLSSDSPVGVSKSMGLAMIGFSDAFMRQDPDIIVLLGDRYEVFCAAAAANVACVPIAHIHGGELTFGALDDAFRHSITKMSHLHFVATEEYRQRVIQLGEAPEQVFNVGALGVESSLSLNLLGKAKLERELGIKFREQNLLITFHPATLDTEPAQEQLEVLLTALDNFPSALKIFTMANADSQGRSINAKLNTYVKLRLSSSVLFSSLGQLRYLSLMKQCDAVIGNSSSGIIEAPSLGVPTVNIGSRQQGRVKAASVIDCPVDAIAIQNAITKAIKFRINVGIPSNANPYYGGNTSKKIADILVSSTFPELIHKKFFTIRNN